MCICVFVWSMWFPRGEGPRAKGYTWIGSSVTGSKTTGSPSSHKQHPDMHFAWEAIKHNRKTPSMLLVFFYMLHLFCYFVKLLQEPGSLVSERERERAVSPPIYSSGVRKCK